MSTDCKIRVLCIDDHPAIRRLFELLMRDHPDFEMVGTDASADHLEEKVGATTPDVVLLDISMRGRDPLEAMTSVRQMFPDVRFLVCSSWEDQDVVERAMAAGATGYLVKEGVFEEMVQAIRKVARNEKVVPLPKPSGPPRHPGTQPDPSR